MLRGRDTTDTHGFGSVIGANIILGHALNLGVYTNAKELARVISS